MMLCGTIGHAETIGNLTHLAASGGPSQALPFPQGQPNDLIMGIDVVGEQGKAAHSFVEGQGKGHKQVLLFPQNIFPLAITQTGGTQKNTAWAQFPPEANGDTQSIANAEFNSVTQNSGLAFI
jgi:hypothetical protein